MQIKHSKWIIKLRQLNSLRYFNKYSEKKNIELKIPLLWYKQTLMLLINCANEEEKVKR